MRPCDVSLPYPHLVITSILEIIEVMHFCGSYWLYMDVVLGTWCEACKATVAHVLCMTFNLCSAFALESMPV